MDKEADVSEARTEVASISGDRSAVPQTWVDKKYIGGLGDLKALDMTGDLGKQRNPPPRSTAAVDAEKALDESVRKSTDAAVALFPGPEAAFLSAFHSPATVDHRVVRVTSILTFFMALFAGALAWRDEVQWLVLGMFVDCSLKLGGFPSPVDLLAALPFAGSKPHFSAGASQQFNNLVGVVLTFASWASLVAGYTVGAYVLLAVLAGTMFLQGFLNFCAGSFVLDYMMKWGLVSKSVYRVHIKTRPSLERAWQKSGAPSKKAALTEAVTYPTVGLPPNPTDLRAKPRKAGSNGKTFHLIKYCHINYFIVPLSILGLGLPWAILAKIIGMGWMGIVVWQTLAWIGVSVDVMLGALYIAKCFLYPSKVKKEWFHPIHHNSFAIPFITLIFMAWMSTMWSGDPTGKIAMVLFWLGAIPLSSITIYTIASWIAFPVDEEHIHPSWMVIPVGNLAGAVTAMLVDRDYIDWGWFQFSLGTLLWLALWPTTFRKAVLGHNSNAALRNLYGVWVAPPAVAMLAFNSLEDSTAIGPVHRALFYASLSVALVLAPCVWPLNFFQEGQFAMTAWAFAFPLNALAAAAVTMYGLSPYSSMQVLYVVTLSVATVVNVVNALYTLAALKAKRLFTPGVKWSPLSFVALTHTAFRESVQTLEKLTEAVKPVGADDSDLRQLAASWSAISHAHRIHCMHQDKVIFPALEAFFPGQTIISAVNHDEHKRLMQKIQNALDTLLSCSGGVDGKDCRATLLAALKYNLGVFQKELMDHLDHKELFFSAPVARKYLPMKTTKDLVRDSWNATPSSDMTNYMRWVMANLPAREQKTRFLKTWSWAMPERAQHVGLMVYRVVDDVTWVQVARDIPEMIPRGLPGHRRYF